MFIEIGKKIKQLRNAKGISQEFLSKYLKMPIKALIRIESGEEYPPIEMIPVIADYFEVTTDEIMCMEQFDHEDKIREYAEKFQEFVESDNLRAAIDTIREALVHFPRNFRLKYMLLYALYLSCDRPSAIKHYSDEIKSIYEDILANCTDDSIRLEAKRILCLHCYNDLRDVEMARRIAMSLPKRLSCREDMLPNVSEGEERLIAYQENIISYTEKLTSAIEACAELDGTLSKDQKTQLYELAAQIRRGIYPEGDFYGLYATMMETCHKLAALYMDKGDTEKTLSALDEAARYAAAGDAVKDIKYRSPLVNRVQSVRVDDVSESQARGGKKLRDIFLDRIIISSKFEPIRYDPRIKEICDIFLNF